MFAEGQEPCRRPGVFKGHQHTGVWVISETPSLSKSLFLSALPSPPLLSLSHMSSLALSIHYGTFDPEGFKRCTLSSL